MSLDSLMDLKGIKVKNHKSRRNMKSWLTRTYKDKINKGQFVMSKDSLSSVGNGGVLTSEIFPLSDNTTITHAVNALCAIIDDYTSGAEELP